jgi:predicted metal-dependent peptidase
LSVEKIITELLINNPYYGYLASKLRFRSSNQVQHMKLKWCEVPTVLYNEEWFNLLSKKQQMSMIVHELIHVALLHFYRRDGRDLIIWNVACDIAVSELMSDFEPCEDIVTSDIASRELGISIEPKRNAEYYYNELMEVNDSISFTNEAGEAKIAFDGGNYYDSEVLEEMSNDNVESKAMVQELNQIRDMSLEEGALGEELMTEVIELYSDYRIHWRNVLKKFLAGDGRIKKKKSYKGQSRRFEDMPGTKRTFGFQALLAIDESGSITDTQIEAFRKEMVRINKISGNDMLVVRFDMTCSEPMRLNQFITSNKRERRGGTDFKPVFNFANKIGIRNIILFTDGEGNAPATVQQRVLWVLTNEGKNPSDFGAEVRFQQV